MHAALAEELLKEVRGRISEGDYPSTQPLSTELLEDLANTLAYQRDQRIAELERQLAELERNSMGEHHVDRANDRPNPGRIVYPEKHPLDRATPEGGWNTDKPRANMRGLPLALLLSVALWFMIAYAAMWLWSLVGG